MQYLTKKEGRKEAKKARQLNKSLGWVMHSYWILLTPFHLLIVLFLSFPLATVFIVRMNFPPFDQQSSRAKTWIFFMFN